MNETKPPTKTLEAISLNREQERICKILKDYYDKNNIRKFHKITLEDICKVFTDYYHKRNINTPNKITLEETHKVLADYYDKNIINTPHKITPEETCKDLPDYYDKEDTVKPHKIALEKIYKALVEYYGKKNITISNKITLRDIRNIYIGAIYAMRLELRSNPDWMSQSAHSFRELLYPAMWHKFRESDKWTSQSADLFRYMYEVEIYYGNTIYGEFCNICHHQVRPRKSKAQKSKEQIERFNKTEFKKQEKKFKNPVEKFEDLVETFENLVLHFSNPMTDMLKEIETLVTKNPLEYDDQDELKDKVEGFHSDPITKGHFYAHVKTNREWFDWLWKNSFLKELTK